MSLKNSRKRSSALPSAEVNLTSLMDILTTLLFFILVAMGIEKFSVLESTSLLSGKSSSEEIPTFTLQLTFQNNKKCEVWLGATEKLSHLKNKNIPESHLLTGGFSGTSKTGYIKNIETDNINNLLNETKNALKIIKQMFPQELKIVVSYHDQLNYQDMIQILESVKELPATDSPLKYENANGVVELSTVLFPQVIIAEISGDKS